MTDLLPATVLELRESAAAPARRRFLIASAAVGLVVLVWVVALNAVGILRVRHLRGIVGR